MKYLRYIFSFIILLFYFTGYSQTYTQPANIISSGGGESNVGNYSNFGVLGETFDNITLSGGNYDNLLGFLYSTSYSTVRINKVEYSQKIIVYPNPSRNKLFFKSSNSTLPQKIQLYNLFGQKVIESKFVNTIDISGFPNGLYLVKLIGKKGKAIHSVKILKE